MFNIPDLDIDLSSETRKDMLAKLHHIPAAKLNSFGIYPHNVGVYFCDVPIDRVSGLCSIDYKRAEEEYGFYKIDMLHNSIYDNFNSRDEVIESVNKEPNWNMLSNQLIVEKLPHVNNYYTLIQKLPKIDSVEKLAKFLAIIRPAKKYLIPMVEDNGWDSIDNLIWKKEDNGDYQYKKSHSIAYAVSIVVMMNKMEG